MPGLPTCLWALGALFIWHYFPVPWYWDILYLLGYPFILVLLALIESLAAEELETVLRKHLGSKS